MRTDLSLIGSDLRTYFIRHLILQTLERIKNIVKNIINHCWIVWSVLDGKMNSMRLCSLSPVNYSTRDANCTRSKQSLSQLVSWPRICMYDIASSLSSSPSDISTIDQRVCNSMIRQCIEHLKSSNMIFGIWYRYLTSVYRDLIPRSATYTNK